MREVGKNLLRIPCPQDHACMNSEKTIPFISRRSNQTLDILYPSSLVVNGASPWSVLHLHIFYVLLRDFASNTLLAKSLIFFSVYAYFIMPNIFYNYFVPFQLLDSRPNGGANRHFTSALRTIYLTNLLCFFIFTLLHPLLYSSFSGFSGNYKR